MVSLSCSAKMRRGGGRRLVLGGGHTSEGVKRYSDQHHDPGLRGNRADRIAIHIIEPDPAHRYEDARPQQKTSEPGHRFLSAAAA